MGAVALNKRTKRGRVEGSAKAMADFNAKRKDMEQERITKAFELIEEGKTNKQISDELGVCLSSASRYRILFDKKMEETILERVVEAAGSAESIAFIKETRPDIAFYLEKGMDFILSDVNIKNIVVAYFR